MSTAAALHFACNGCGKQYKWKPEIAGKKAKCTCGASMQVPADSPNGVAVATAPKSAFTRPAAPKPVTTLKPGLAAAGVKVAPVPARPKPVAPPPPPPPAEEEEDNGLYDFAEDNQPQYTYAPQPAPPMASEIPTAVPLGRTGSRGGTLGYATAGAGADELPLLGDADLDWVMKLRNAARLMVGAISFGFIARFFLPSTQLIEGGVDVVIAAINLTAAWLLTCAEPGADDSRKIFTSRIFLRVASVIAGVGQILMAAGAMISDEDSGLSPIFGAGSIIYLVAGTPAIFLFLWYLAKLAKRIPAPGLAVNCYIVMIGLPTVVAASTLGGYLAISSKSAGAGILSLLGGILGLLIFRIWYLIILIWFNKSFS